MKEPKYGCVKCGQTVFMVRPVEPGSRTYLFDCVNCGQGKFIMQPEVKS